MVSDILVGDIEPEWKTDGFGLRGEQVEPSDDDDLVWDTDVWTRLNPEQDAIAGSPSGACCHADGTCEILSQSDCEADGSFYQGDGTDCETGCCLSSVTISGTISATDAFECGTFSCPFTWTWLVGVDFNGYDVCLNPSGFSLTKTLDVVSCLGCSNPLDIFPTGTLDIGILISPTGIVMGLSVRVACNPFTGCNANGNGSGSLEYHGHDTYSFIVPDDIFFNFGTVSVTTT